MCGKVRYELRGEPKVSYYCHCGKCRKQSGSSFATNMVVGSDDFTIVEGKEMLSSFESSPRKYRYFCKGCGSPIYSQGESTRNFVSVRCGTLDTDLTVPPSVHAFVASKANWFDIRDGLAQHPEYFG
jgi:hypothetical protein